MKKYRQLLINMGFVLIISLIQGCTNYEPVSVEQCKNVVTHAQKVLGKLSPSYKELLESCKAASDDKRGCIMAAKKMGQITQCD